MLLKVGLGVEEIGYGIACIVCLFAVIWADLRYAVALQ